jgi:hypothetical protein
MSFTENPYFVCRQKRCTKLPTVTIFPARWSTEKYGTNEGRGTKEAGKDFFKVMVDPEHKKANIAWRQLA